ncbi:MAG: SGNH/GDSL hydrolase family protein [Roseburia sp.]|nr:SGNH/GDSL hydrolase family protein [Roseburia sp.]
MRIYNWEKSVLHFLNSAHSREIAIIGNDVFTLEIYHTVKKMGYPIGIIISDRRDLFQNTSVKILNESEFLQTENKNYYYIVAEIIGHKEVHHMLTTQGFILKKDFSIMGIGGYTKLLTSIDSLLTLNRSENGSIGFEKLGEFSNQKFNIVILGNSTSDPSTGMLKSWPEYLFENLQKAGLDIAIYNGAITGYSSTQEFLKLCRDVLDMNPNLVISYSGFNDVQGNSTVEGFPYLHKYGNKFFEFLKTNPRLAPDSMYVRNVSAITHGLETKKKDYEIWIDNMRKMFAVCKEFGIKFHAYLQPMVECSGAIKTKEQAEIVQEYYRLTNSAYLAEYEKTFCSEVQKYIDGKNYITNLTNIFKDKYNVFYDICHCTEYGNAIIAEYIYQDIVHDLHERSCK